MYPSLKIFGVEIFLYNICAMSAFLIAIFVFVKRTKNVFGPGVQDSIIAIMGMDIPFIIVGAILHNKFSYENSVNNFFDILFVNTGFAFFGGFIGGVLGFLVLYPIIIGKKAEMTIVMSELVPSIIVGHAIGRLGCLFGGCCYGKPFKWGIGYKVGTPAYSAYGMQKLFPVPLVEIVLLLVLLILVLVIRKKVISVYLIGYSGIRFFLEFLRGDIRGGNSFLSPAQKICIGILIITLCMNYISRNERNDIKIYSG